MKKRNDLGAVGVEILLVPVIVIAAVLYFASVRVETMPIAMPIENPEVGINPVEPPSIVIEDPTDSDELNPDVPAKEDDGKLDIVTSLEDTIDDDAAWCGIFNLIWNDLRDEIAKQDIVFAVQNEVVKNLNKGTFTVKDIAEASYYKTYGAPTLALKAEIEKAIKEKFDQESDILDEFDWNGSQDDYILYGMLYKEFEFPKVFTKLGEDNFGDGETAKYFGIDGSTKDDVKAQVRVLYYYSEDDFAIKLETKQNDEVIVAVGTKANTFLDIYNSIQSRAQKYEGAKYLKERDRVKIPNIEFNLKEEIEEVQNKAFLLADGREYMIYKALQTIQFELDEEGGKIKSEAGIGMKNTSIAMPETPRNFYVDQAFTIFLVEEGEELPYFAAKISDINNIQE